jgi:hypothetical protein
MPKLTNAQWRKKFLADQRQKNSHRQVIQKEIALSQGYSSDWLDLETANLFANRVNIPIANVEIEAAWEEFNAEQLRKLNPLVKEK